MPGGGVREHTVAFSFLRRYKGHRRSIAARSSSIVEQGINRSPHTMPPPGKLGAGVSVTSSGETSNCHTGTSSTFAISSNLETDGFLNIAFTFCFVVFIISANCVFFIPFCNNTSSILFIYIMYNGKIIILLQR